jgi:hypothetical protein
MWEVRNTGRILLVSALQEIDVPDFEITTTVQFAGGNDRME